VDNGSALGKLSAALQLTEAPPPKKTSDDFAFDTPDHVFRRGRQLQRIVTID
jgi:hypothetical protein